MDWIETHLCIRLTPPVECQYFIWPTRKAHRWRAARTGSKLDKERLGENWDTGERGWKFSVGLEKLSALSWFVLTMMHAHAASLRREHYADVCVCLSAAIWWICCCSDASHKETPNWPGNQIPGAPNWTPRDRLPFLAFSNLISAEMKQHPSSSKATFSLSASISDIQSQNGNFVFCSFYQINRAKWFSPSSPFPRNTRTAANSHLALKKHWMAQMTLHTSSFCEPPHHKMRPKEKKGHILICVERSSISPKFLLMFF